jgi:hypothetical protein
MKRLLVLVISLFVLSVGLFAMPLFPLTVTKLPLSNGHTLELNFFAPKESLPFFDKSILTNGFAQLSKTYNLSNDFSVYFTPQSTNELLFMVSFDGLTSGLSATLHPTTNAAGLRGLPLAAPRDALAIVQSWYKSFLANPSTNKSDSFVPLMRKTTFIVDYSATAPITGGGVRLAMHGSFQDDTPVFGPKMELMQLDASFLTHHIELASPDYLDSLQNDYFYILDPISDPANPGLKRESVTVYMLFDKTAPK